MALQALEYEKANNINLESFFKNTRDVVSDNRIKVLLREIEKLRKES
jgi:hypothetical protein